MKYSKEEIGFILYNNRSVKGVISNFFDPNINPIKLNDIEEKFNWVKSIYSNLDQFVEVDLSLINQTADDEIVTPKQLSDLTDLIISNIGKFSDKEEEFLVNRKITISLAKKWSLLGLSNIKNEKDLITIGATSDPILRNFLIDGIDGGGIIQPLFNDNKLINCSIRKISDVGKLKYTLAVPDIPIWGLDDCYKEDIWICEGVFDMIALREQGIKAISPSSASWSGIQLYKLLDLNPKSVTIMADNDNVGLKSALIMYRFLNLMMIPVRTVRSTRAKDSAEHFLEMGLSINEIEEVKITHDMIKYDTDESFNFLKYLKNRKF